MRQKPVVPVGAVGVLALEFADSQDLRGTVTLVRGDARDDGPDILHKRIERRFGQAFNIAMRRIVKRVGFG